MRIKLGLILPTDAYIFLWVVKMSIVVLVLLSKEQAWIH